MSSPALYVPYPWLVTIAPLPSNRFPNKLAPNVPNSILRSPLFYSFASFLVVSLMSFINKLDSSSKWLNYFLSFISSLETINVVLREAKSEGRLDLNIFLWIVASVADAAAVNPNVIKTF